MSVKNRLIAGTVLLIVFAGLATSVVRVAQPPLTLNLVSRFTTNDIVEFTLGLTNRGRPITFTGYSKDSPVYTSFNDSPSGRVINSGFWCGTGMMEHSLSRNEGVQFKLSFAATNGPTGVIMNYSETRLFDRLLFRAPNFIRAKLPLREYRSVEVRLSG